MIRSSSGFVGLGEFKGQLKRIGGAASGAALVAAGEAALQEPQNAAIGNIEEQGLILTGTLRRSLSIEVVKSSAMSCELAWGTNVVYAAIHEFGGIIRQTNAFGRGIQANITIPARPYMRPAWLGSQDSMLNVLKQSITAAIRAAL